MAIDYFDTFPRVDYDMGKDNKTRSVTNLLKRIGIRGDFKNLLPTYYKSILSASERPELSAYTTYGDIFSHWVLLHMNTVTDPYHDWVMEETVLNEFVDLKYPDSSLLLESTHHSDTTYGAVDPSTKRFFVKGEVIKEYQADDTLLNGVGTVVDFDATLIQITYKLTSGSFDDADQYSGSYVKGDDSGAVGKLAGVTTERLGVHHYESADGIEVGRSHNGALAITNETFENNENEKKREIMILQGNYLQQFEQNFEDMMNA
ncbi:hypothetical protein CMI47_14695 [Candidatus Pacearchaeota archaeon]|nr:hypothetical protein [Candidatus Pacearchaeota archaeon]